MDRPHDLNLDLIHTQPRLWPGLTQNDSSLDDLDLRADFDDLISSYSQQTYMAYGQGNLSHYPGSDATFPYAQPLTYTGIDVQNGPTNVVTTQKSQGKCWGPSISLGHVA